MTQRLSWTLLAIGTFVSAATLAEDAKTKGVPHTTVAAPDTETTPTNPATIPPEPGSLQPGQERPMGSHLPGVAPRPAPNAPVDLDEAMLDWPAESQRAAESLHVKYGEPDEVSASRIVWNNTGRFKRSIVFKEAVAHDFPVPHKDVLEQVIDYKVPPEKCDELATFDGSLVVKRTRGELAVIGDTEQANILALNLADDIVRGRRGVEDARDFMARTTAELARGEQPAQATTLFVELFKSDTQDRDHPSKSAMRALEKAR